jgi:hypothetical protein
MQSFGICMTNLSNLQEIRPLLLGASLLGEDFHRRSELMQLRNPLALCMFYAMPLQLNPLDILS